jgi:hypothetical protein
MLPLNHQKRSPHHSGPPPHPLPCSIMQQRGMAHNAPRQPPRYMGGSLPGEWGDSHCRAPPTHSTGKRHEARRNAHRLLYPQSGRSRHHPGRTPTILRRSGDPPHPKERGPVGPPHSGTKSPQSQGRALRPPPQPLRGKPHSPQTLAPHQPRHAASIRDPRRSPCRRTCSDSKNGLRLRVTAPTGPQPGSQSRLLSPHLARIIHSHSPRGRCANS